MIEEWGTTVATTFDCHWKVGTTNEAYCGADNDSIHLTCKELGTPIMRHLILSTVMLLAL